MSEVSVQVDGGIKDPFINRPEMKEIANQYVEDTKKWNPDADKDKLAKSVMVLASESKTYGEKGNANTNSKKMVLSNKNLSGAFADPGENTFKSPDTLGTSIKQ